MDNEERLISAQELLETIKKKEDELIDAFPGRFDKCAYDKGNIKQTVYSCLSCYQETGKLAGFCYSCAVSVWGFYFFLIYLNKVPRRTRPTRYSR